MIKQLGQEGIADELRRGVDWQHVELVINEVEPGQDDLRGGGGGYTEARWEYFFVKRGENFLHANKEKFHVEVRGQSRLRVADDLEP
jgi:hypothetical protein